ncbi:peptidase M15B and M15C, D,D-carboxypeptidase VanY/endolysin [Calothrix sp. NIES-4071]|nr:peptidase M15B and M15C, D,D-carboxypeptidase VanY/endolysin [Calothrix sp. NIES-4071]BAZ60587.1 peptidase M15B and M15C, D,D-carboxypeptidase VanY/endolysin [Calothrix sp. NIES-4105]
MNININMKIFKNFLKRGIYVCLVIFTSLTLVASNGNFHHAAGNKDLKTDENCLIEGASQNLTSQKRPCIVNPTPSLTPTPTLNFALPQKERFLAFITTRLPIIPNPGSFEYIMLRQYGAPFITLNSEIKLPPKVFFPNPQETRNYQTSLVMGKVNSGNNCFLQKAAADAFNIADKQINIPLKSGYGSGDCTRTYETNLRFWRKYASNNTLERVKQGRETAILNVVAPPGTSQHLWGLAIDLRVSTAAQRKALNQNGWFQTVETDTPHWTYLGVPEEKLPDFGFNKKIVRGITYWLTPL